MCREELGRAERYFSDGKYEEASKSLALSFEYLINDYISHKKTEYGRSSFWFGSTSPLNSAVSMGVEGRLGNFVDDVNDSLGNIQKALRILSLNIDYRKYTKFRLLTPNLLMFGNDIIFVSKSKKIFTELDMTFCKNFIIESALNLQEFDYGEK
jgi:hypothetical protein